MGVHSDGGRAALGGFLYQIVAVLGLRALVETRSDREYELATLLEVNGPIRIEHEKFDSDAVIEKLDTDGGRISLVQFKYSRQVPPPSVGQAEYIDIIRALSNAGTRGIRARSSRLTASSRIGHSAPSARQVPKEAGPRSSEPPGCAAEDRARSWLGGLEKFGRSFGRDEPGDRGGDLRAHRPHHVLDRQRPPFHRTRRPCQGPRRLRGRQANPPRRPQARMREDLRRVSEDLWPPGEPIRRKQWDEISRAIFSDWRALVVLMATAEAGRAPPWRIGSSDSLEARHPIARASR